MARSFLYMPQEITRFILQNINISTPDNRLETPMAQGTHLRLYGESVIKKITFRMLVPRNRIIMFSDFFTEVYGHTFWSLFPLQADPRIEPGKYYCFDSAKVDSFPEETTNADYFDIPLELNWHFKVPPRDYGQQ